MNNFKLDIENVIEYVDKNSDGGIWFNVTENVGPVLFAMSQKLLKALGYESIEELQQVHPNMTEYLDVCNVDDMTLFKNEHIIGKKERAQLDIILKTKVGQSLFYNMTITRSNISGDSEGILYKGELSSLSIDELIFKNSRNLLDNLENGICIVQKEEGKDYHAIYVNSGFMKMLFISDDKGFTDSRNLFFPHIYKADENPLRKVFEKVLTDNSVEESTFRCFDDKGKVVWIHAIMKGLTIGSAKYIYISFMNVSEMRNEMDETKKISDKLAELVDIIPVGMVVFNEINGDYVINAINSEMVVYINKMTRYEDRYKKSLKKEDCLGIELSRIYNFLEPGDIKKSQDAIKAAREKGEVEYTIATLSYTNEGNAWLRISMKSKPMGYGKQQLICVCHDVTRQVRYEQQLKKDQEEMYRLSYLDSLTGVLNRHSYKSFLDENPALDNCGVAFVDLNGLKTINDKFGHIQGDAEILKVANDIKEDFFKARVFRISGDEFVIIWPGVDRVDFDGLCQCLNARFKVTEAASVGWIWQEKVSNLVKTVDRAEELMRIAKQEYYSSHQEVQSKHRPAILNELLTDIESGRYKMYLQPKASILDTKVIGAEALVRKVDKEGNIVAPFKFIPQLEHEKLISNVDFFMLEEVCKVLSKWNNEHIRPIKISVNMSRVTLAEPDYMQRLLSIVDRYDVSRSQIELEVTESNNTIDGLKMEDIIADIKKEGFGVSLDDMGTEYSSLHMLPMNGIDTVKLDRSFVLKVDEKQGNILLSHVIQMCHDLGQITIAEGVEDHHTREALQALGCDMYQGYLLAKPIPVDEFEKLI